MYMIISFPAGILGLSCGIVLGAGVFVKGVVGSGASSMLCWGLAVRSRAKELFVGSFGPINARNSNLSFDDLQDFLQLQDLNQISTRVFYLYLRPVQASEEDRTTLFNYFLAILGSITGAGGLIVALLNYGNVRVLDWTLVGSVVIIVILLIVRIVVDPNAKAKQDLNKIWLSLHLDQIEKQSIQILALQSILKRDPNNAYAKELQQDSCTVLRDSLKRVGDIKAIGDNKLKEALGSIHVSKELLSRRISFGNKTLDENCPRTNETT